MKNFSIHLKSYDASNIYVNGNFAGLIDNVENFSIDIKVYCKTLTITKEPISQHKKLLLPYTVKLNFNSKISCNSDYVTIVPYKNDEHDILLDSCKVSSHKKLEKIYDDFVDNYNLIVVNDGASYINLYHMNVLKFSITTAEITNVVCEKKNDFILIKGSTGNGYHLIILNEQNNFNVVYNSVCDKIEQTNSHIKILQKLNDIARHAYVTVFNFENGLKEDEYVVYLNEKEVLCEQNKLVPYAFLEAVKVKNYELAKQYLTPSLIEKTSNEHLENYFTNLQKIFYNTYTNNDNLINYTVLCDDFKSYDFSIKNNKIDDIEEVLLAI